MAEKGKQLPVWMLEDTSFESKHTSSDAEVGTSTKGRFKKKMKKAPQPYPTGQETAKKFAAITQPPHKQVAVLNNAESVHAAKTTVASWINDKMTTSNISDLQDIVTSEAQKNQQQADVYKEFQELCKVIQQLSQELPNVFDNYLCFSGTNDENQMKRLFNLAYERAFANLTAKCPFYLYVTGNLLTLAFDKLFAIYRRENQEICQREEILCGEISLQIINAYEENVKEIIAITHSFDEATHKRLVRFCINMMDRSLDFAAKINNNHSVATTNLETILNEKYRLQKSRKVSAPEQVSNNRPRSRPPPPPGSFDRREPSQDFQQPLKAQEPYQSPKVRDRDSQQPPNVQDPQQSPKLQDLQQRPNLQDLQQRPNLQDLQQPPKVHDLQQRPNLQDLQQPPKVHDVQQPPKAQDLQQPPKAQDIQQPLKVQDRQQSPKLQDLQQQPKVQDLQQLPKAQDLQQPPNPQVRRQLPKAQDPEQPPKAQDPEQPPKVQDPQQPPQTQDSRLRSNSENLQHLPKLQALQQQHHVRTASLEYKEFMDARWKISPDQKAIRTLHDNTSTRITHNLTGEEREAAFSEINRYFIYVSEFFQEFHFQSAGGSLNKKSICVLFTDEGIQFGTWLQGNGEALRGHWDYDLNSSTARTVLKSRGVNLDFLSEFGSKSSSKGLHKNKGLQNTKSLLYDVWKEGERAIGKCDHAFIIVPTWLNMGQRTILREIAYDASIKNVSFLNETSLAAYSLLCKTPGVAGQILVSINVGICGVCMEAYVKNDDSQGISLLASAEDHWDTHDKKKKGFVGKMVTMFTNTFGGSRSRNKRGSRGQDNPVATLGDTYEKLMSRLDIKLRLEKKHCFLLSELPIWRKEYEKFLSIRSSQLVDVGERLLDSGFEFKMALELSKQPEQIRSILVDHPIASMEQEETSKPTHIPQASTRRKLQSVKKRVVKDERTKLLDKCKQMIMQVENGNVRLGVLTTKLVKKSAEKAEALALDSNVKEHVIMEQHEKLDALIKQHKFVISE